MHTGTNRARFRASEQKFEEITESAGSFVVPEGASMLATRYSLAADLAQNGRVLELGCGGGQGLGLIARRSSFVLGADFSAALLEVARSHYGKRIPLVRLDAQALPFSAGSFDLVLLFEAAYYIPDLGTALHEIARVLAQGGKCVIVSANPERPDFIPSPYSVRYHTASDLARELTTAGLRPTTLQGAFPAVAGQSFIARMRVELVREIRNGLVRWGLVPSTLKGRARLKRLLYPRQLRVPVELPEDFAPRGERTDLTSQTAKSFKVIYVIAEK